MLAAVIVPAVIIVLGLSLALTVYVMRHRRLQRSLLSYANSHYDTRSGTARFSTSDDLGKNYKAKNDCVLFVGDNIHAVMNTFYAL